MTKRELLARLGPYEMDEEVRIQHWADGEPRHEISSLDEGADRPIIVIAECSREEE